MRAKISYPYKMTETFSPETPNPEPWNILVVDDDEQVHAATKLVLQRQIILGRPLKLYHAFSAKEAELKLREIPQLAVILLDVVMESDDAGLKLVHSIRVDLQLSEVRIILRTGQPGTAPELQVIQEYDINDYKTKQELTHSKLVTSLTASLRSYQQIRDINQNRKALRSIIDEAPVILSLRSGSSFAEAAIQYLGTLLSKPVEGLMCVRHPQTHSPEPYLHVLGAIGSFKSFVGQELSGVLEPDTVHLITRAFTEKTHLFTPSATTLYLAGEQEESVVFLKTGCESDAQRTILEVFASTLAVGFENLSLIDRLEHAAYFDPLTKLPNRNQFLRILDRESNLRDEQNVVAVVDIDHFADINDGLGHDIGNLLLQAAAQRLVDNLPGCTVARVSTDVFGVFGSDHQVNPTFLNSLFSTPVCAGENQLPLSITIGFCRALEHGESGLKQFKSAIIALNRAKKNLQRRHEYFQNEMEEKIRWQLQVIKDLRLDFAEQRLSLWYQPKINLKTGAAVGFEALLRWRGRNGLELTPDVFIPLAEYSGLIVEIGAWVIEEAARELHELDNAGFTGLNMAVNVSIPQFRAFGLTDSVLNALKRNSIDASRFELEITESIVMDDPHLVVEQLEALRSHGVRIAIDDFGIGFSSLSYLHELPIDILKVDRSFISRMDTEKGRAIVGTIIALCQILKLSTIAEGVETAEQIEVLSALSCDLIQGYYFAKPMPADAIMSWLSERKTV